VGRWNLPDRTPRRSPIELRVQGADELNRVARKLKEAGDKGLRKELYSGLQRATKPIRADVQRSLATVLPQRGGLARKMSRARVTTKIRTSNRNTRLRIEVSSPRGEDIDVKAMDRGRLRHPVFGVWRPNTPTQQIPAGVVTDPLERGAAVARHEAQDALSRVAQKLGGG
jgi:hypothetical protein